MSYTPGPWIVKYEFNVVTAADERSVANTGGYSSTTDRMRVYQENIDNARLISAAPELLAACEALLPHLRRIHWTVPTEWECSVCGAMAHKAEDIPHGELCPVRIAEAAIAKARGEGE